MKAVVMREKDGVVEFLRAATTTHWAPQVSKARVFTNPGHAKNAIRWLVDQGYTDCKYFVQRVLVRPYRIDEPEEYVHSTHVRSY